MNRTVLVGGGVAVVALLGLAAYFLFAGRGGGPAGEPVPEMQGPIALNPVTVITEHSASQSQDGRTLTVAFPKFELVAKPGETAAAVFSTTWQVKLAPEERVAVATATLSGHMKSSGEPEQVAPVPAPAPQPAAPPVADAAGANGTAAPAPADGAAPAAAATPDAAAPAAATPAAPPPAPKATAGDGLARVIVSLGGETTVSEWMDLSGAGADRKLSKAIALIGAPRDLRDGGSIPLTVAVEVSGRSAVETLARVNTLELRLFAENAPLPQPAAPAPVETSPPPPATDAAPATETAPPASTPPAGQNP